jgi:acetate kinase
VLGLSGSSNDMRTLTEKAGAGDERAQLALDVFAYRIKKYIGAYTAALGKLDAVIFTGGIGENAAGIRAAICSDLGQIGIELDESRNKSARSESRVSSDKSRVAVLVVPTNEEAAIAIDTYQMSQA